MQPGINADFWASIGLLVYLLGAPVVVVSTVVMLWTDIATRIRSVRSSAPHDWDTGFFVGLTIVALATVLGGFAETGSSTRCDRTSALWHVSVAV